MKNIFRISGVVLLLFLIHSCKKEKPTPPIVTTTAVAEISYTTATSGGDVTNEGGAPVIARGICWNTATGPSISNSKTTDGAGTGSFTSNLSGLIAGTQYYVRAYATNSAGTAYGNELSFTTNSITPVVPTLSTTAITSITTNSATSGGNITSDGGAAVTASGVCWSTTANPVAAGSHTTDGATTGTFTSSMTGLISSTTYYVRAYATNSVGTAYGNELSFKTLAGIPSLTTTTVTQITSTTATSGGIIISDGGATITASGVCWSTNQNPTTSDDKTSDGTGTGTFTSDITGLIGNTTYYVRAYATNSVGTGYGNQVIFTTSKDNTIPTVTTTNVTTFSSHYATVGGNVSSDGNTTVAERGIFYGTSASPETTGTRFQVGSGTGLFSVILSELDPNTTYYVKAYATNNIGTAYGNLISFTTQILNTVIIFNPNLTYGTMSDIDGNVYKTITIGTQTWMAENLKTTKCNDGINISLITDNDTWRNLAVPGYCWYNNDATTYSATYGALYNWPAVNTGKLCPIGYHVPSDAEWTALTTYLEGEMIAGNKLKETGTTHWQSPNKEAINVTGFTALPGGHRAPELYNINNSFFSVGGYGSWWSSSEYSGTVWFRDMAYSYSSVGRGIINMKYGLSVRCLQDH